MPAEFTNRLIAHRVQHWDGQLSENGAILLGVRDARVAIPGGFSVTNRFSRHSFLLTHA